VNDPRDPGGATMKGITQRVYDAFRHSLGEAPHPVQHISEAELAAIYEEQYWKAIRGDDLPAGVDYCVFDAAVNSGPIRSAKWLQGVVVTKMDGHIGLLTLAAARAMPAETLINRFCARRLDFLRTLPTWGAFGTGWRNRIRELIPLALAMARKE
jgi:lysozyme family protein